MLCECDTYDIVISKEYGGFAQEAFNDMPQMKDNTNRPSNFNSKRRGLKWKDFKRLILK